MPCKIKLMHLYKQGYGSRYLEMKHKTLLGANGSFALRKSWMEPSLGTKARLVAKGYHQRLGIDFFESQQPLDLFSHLQYSMVGILGNWMSPMPFIMGI